MAVREPSFAVFVNGGYGVGKSAVLDQIGDLLADARQPFALMDVDWFHRSWPPAVGDEKNRLLEARNMAAVWEAYRLAGPRRLVVCGTLESSADRCRYQEALDLPLRSVRLTASADITRERLIRRYQDARPGALAWHLARYEQLADHLDSVTGDELVIDSDDATAHAVAQRIVRYFALVGVE